MANGNIDEAVVNGVEVAVENIDDALINQFRGRSRTFTVVSYSILLLVFLLLGAAGYIFFFAQKFDARQGSAASLQVINAELESNQALVPVVDQLVGFVSQEREIGSLPLSSELDALQRQFDTRRTVALLEVRKQLLIDFNYINNSDEMRTKEEIKVVIDFLMVYKEALEELKAKLDKQFDAGEVTRTDPTQTQARLYNVSGELAKAELQSKNLPGVSVYVEESGNIDALDLIRVNLVRFGGVSVTLFLIAILIPIYRYNVRLASYYLSRADGLELCKTLGCRSLEAMVEIMTPTHAFEKEPVTPLDALAKVTGSLAGGRVTRL